MFKIEVISSPSASSVSIFGIFITVATAMSRPSFTAPAMLARSLLPHTWSPQFQFWICIHKFQFVILNFLINIIAYHWRCHMSYILPRACLRFNLQINITVYHQQHWTGSSAYTSHEDLLPLVSPLHGKGEGKLERERRQRWKPSCLASSASTCAMSKFYGKAAFHWISLAFAVMFWFRCWDIRIFDKKS